MKLPTQRYQLVSSQIKKGVEIQSHQGLIVMFFIDFVLLAAYIFVIAGAFFPKTEPEPEKTPEKDLEDALLKYIGHINKKVSNKTE